MSVAPPANPRDVQDFQFKLLCRLRVFTPGSAAFSSAVNLVASASKYGFIFVGCPTGIQVLTSSSIFGLDHHGGANSGEIANYPRREIPLPSQPSHLNISCDQSYLVVAIKKDGCAHALIYSVPSFAAANIVLVNEIRLSTIPETSVLELTWNPGIANVLASCLSDGSMAVYELKQPGIEISTLPPTTQANCFCWSPKGKQLVVGTEVGTLTQYKPDLKSVKTFSPPNLGSGNVAVVNVLWLSNYQFAAVYRDKINTEERPGLLIVNAPKVGALNFVNYEDICYSAGELRPPQYYLIHQPTWNILMVASANSMEVGVMGLQDDQISWEQWTQEDAARAELPLSVEKQETFPVGITWDTSTQNDIPWGENQSLAPMPMLNIMSHEGVLCLFYAINLRPDAARLCSPPEKFPDERVFLHFFTTTPSAAQVSPIKAVPALLPPGVSQQGMGTGVAKPVQPIMSAPLQSGNALTGVQGMQSNLPQSTPQQPLNAFSFNDPNVRAVPTSGFGSTPSIFGSGTPTAFSTGQAGPPSSTFGSGLISTPSTAFGSGLTSATPSSFSTSASNPPTTSISTAMTGFGSNPSSITFGALSSAGNPPSLSIGTSSTTSTTKTFSFLSNPTPTTAATNVKPVLSSNFGFTTPASSSTTVTQQITKPTFSPAVPVPTAAVKPQTSFLGGSLPSLEQTIGSSVTITKVPAIPAVPAVQPAKIEAPSMEIKQVQKPVTPPVTVLAKPVAPPPVNNSVFFNAIKEEVTHFECELKELRSRVNGTSVQVGSEEEKRMLRQKVDRMEEFWNELKDTTQAQSSEIHGLKSVLMESFALAEEAKSRMQQLNSPMYVQLVRSQSLDPVSSRCAENIKHLVYYVENQLRQVNEQLDSNWLEFQDSCKPSVKNKMYIPSLESVYQAMVVQNNILNKQRVIMADVARRAQEQGRNNRIPLISSAVLARVRDKESSQVGRGETELSRLAENLVKIKLEPSDAELKFGMGFRCRRLSRKKESFLRDLLSQSTVTRVCPTKPARPVLGGISTGKPIISKIDTPAHLISRDTSRLSAGTAITEPKISPPAVSIVRTDTHQSQSPLFLFGTSKTSGESDKGFGNRGFAMVLGKSAPTGKEIPVPPSGIFAPTVDSSKTKPNISDSSFILPKPSFSNDFISKGSSGGEFAFSTPLLSGKSSVPTNFSFGAGLSKVPSVGKLNDASRKLEEYYEDVSPPSTPENKETVPSPGNTSTSAAFTFSFSVTPTTKSNVPSNSVSGMASTTPKSPLLSLDSIVSGIGESNTSKPLSKPVIENKPVVTSSTSSTAIGSTPFSFGSLGQTQSAGSTLGKPDEPKKPLETFKFSLTSTPFSTVPPPSPASSSGNTSPKLPNTISGVNLKTPLLTSFGTPNVQTNASPQISIFGGEDGSKPPTSFTAASGNSVATTSSSKVFAQSTSTLFGSLTSVSPAKQPAPANIFGGEQTTPVTSFSFVKQNTDSVTSAVTSSTESQEQKIEPAPKEPLAEVTSSGTENLFSSSTSLFGNLSVGSGITPKPVTAGSIFGGGASVPISTSFVFGKPPATTESQTAAPESNKVDSSADSTQVQKPVDPPKDVEPPVSKPSIAAIFGVPEVKSESSEGTNSQQTPSTTPTESTSALTFSFASQLSTGTPTTSASQTSNIFGQGTDATKSLTGSIFGGAVTTQSAPVTTSATPTSTTFTFAIPSSTSSPFGQKTTNIFGQTAPTTTSSSVSFFGQPICTPSAFGQSTGNVFGQTPTTTAAKTNVFGQVATTTSAPSVFAQASSTTQSVFGQSSSSPPPPPFGQPPSSGSSFGFGSKPAFGQTGGSLFGQSGSSGFASGGSIFGGGTAGTSIFGGGQASGQASGTMFQSSAGGSIFGGSSSPNSGNNTGGAFSSGIGQSISQSGFGSPTAFQSKPGGFGGSPVFDRAAPGFGSPPSFGGAPTFGGSPTFGSPGKVFGSTSPTATVGFGATGQQSSTFESLATQQNTMTFGNLAQNQTPSFGSPTPSVFGASQPQPTPSGSAFSGGSSSSFGGSSFSSWR